MKYYKQSQEFILQESMIHPNSYIITHNNYCSFPRGALTRGRSRRNKIIYGPSFPGFPTKVNADRKFILRWIVKIHSALCERKRLNSREVIVRCETEREFSS